MRYTFATPPELQSPSDTNLLGLEITQAIYTSSSMRVFIQDGECSVLACDESDTVIGLKRTIEREFGEVFLYQNEHKTFYTMLRCCPLL